MGCIITFDQNGNKNGVEENNDLFQEIWKNPHVKSFDEAIEIFKQTYSDKIEINNTGKTQNFFSDVVNGISDKYKSTGFWRPIIPFTAVQEKFKTIYDPDSADIDGI